MQRRALIIGISDYDKLQNLSFCKNDGNSIYKTLSWGDYIIPNDRKLIGRINWAEMRNAIIDFFVDPSISPEDILIFYYSGHGIPDIDADMYLSTSEIDPDAPYRNGFSFNELTKMAQRTIATRVILILDCCYSGSARISKGYEGDAAKLAYAAVNNRFNAISNGEGICLLAASQAYQEASVLVEKNHSLFTYYLLEGLQGKSKEVFDYYGNVTIDTLSKYVYSKIMSLPLEKRPKQRPLRKIEASGDIILIDGSHYSGKRTLPVIEPRKDKETNVLTSHQKTLDKSSPRLIERTLYPPLIEYLRTMGFEAIGEAGLSEGDSDVVFSINHHRFVLEIKIEKFSSALSTKAIAQAFNYARQYETHDVIVMIYPESIKNRPIPDDLWLKNIALNETVRCHIFTEYWQQTLQSSPDQIFSELKSRIETKNRKIDLNSVIKQIQTIVKDLNTITAYVKKEDLVSEVVDKLDLFTSIGEIKDMKLAEKQVTTLSSYLLFNQLLFYQIYQKKNEGIHNKNLNLPELRDITKIRDLQTYFDAITAIDFNSIYRTNILGHLSENPLVIDILNQVIRAIKLLRAELITHDLAGRFFHNLLPDEVRKILAAYYTHPNSADLLAGLTVTSWDDKVIDPACGSGTLLVSCYKAKMKLYNEAHGFKNFNSVHKKFLEEDIAGSDIMPFASHLTTINLAIQNIDQHTDIVRIASMDSLGLATELSSLKFKKGKGLEVEGFERVVQLTLTNKVAWSRKRGSVSMDGRGSKFYLTPYDVVIMNPPFSDREKMPAEMREELNNNTTLNKIVGQQVNLWGPFIGLADLLLKPSGFLGLVIPINIGRGQATQRVRDFLLNNYTSKLILTAIEDDAFSEGAKFRDILYIAQKGKPSRKDLTGIVSLKVSLRALSHDEIQALVTELKECYYTQIPKNTPSFEIKFFKTKELLSYNQNLMPLIGFKSSENQQIIANFLDTVRAKSEDKLTKIDEHTIREGLHVSPAGLSELVFMTKPIDKSRTKRAFLVLDANPKLSHVDSLKVKVKNSDIFLDIPITKTMPALRTLTSVRSFNVKEIDRILFQRPEEFDSILQLSKWKGKFDWFKHAKNVKEKASYVVVGRRFRPNSDNTHHFAFYANNKIVSPDTFKILDFSNEDDALIQTLILNSSITMANIMMLKEQTTGGFTDIRGTELKVFDIFNIKNLSYSDKEKLRKLFGSLAKSEFPSIREQYVSSNELRYRLDSEILEVLGFGVKDIKNVLDKVYKTIADELERNG